MTKIIQNLSPGATLTNTELCNIFGCSPQGGMRRSKSTNSLILISNHVESIYDDRWVDEVLHYTGMGRQGDQSLEFHQNKTLNNSNETKVNVYLFEVFEDLKYIFQGQVELCQKPYKEPQLDVNGSFRSAWVFPIKLIEGKPISPNDYVADKVLLDKVKKVYKKIPIKNIKLQAEKSLKATTYKKSVRLIYNRDPFIVAYALHRANGYCQLCDEPAPFNNKDGIPFLEVHHVVYLSKGGSDSFDNVVALCPNCHRRIHMLEIKREVYKLASKAKIKLVI